MGGTSSTRAAKRYQPPNQDEMSDEEVGSVWEQLNLPPGRSPTPQIAPPLNGRCFLLDCLNADAFEMVLDKMSTRDLVALMVTSKNAKSIVDQYVEHKLRKDQRRVQCV